jgi:NAD(P)-dependent dehydrogenase (short-subunit alcohol dehydrogenase family)
VIGLVRCVASEVGSFGVTVNAIAPGLTRTPGTAAGPQGELGWFESIREA